MSKQSPSESDVTDCSVTDDKNVAGTKQTITFEWTTELEQCLLFNMDGLKSCGIHKHKSDYLLKERMRKQLNIDIPLKVLRDYINSKWDIKAADKIEVANLDTMKKDDVLPEEYDQLIVEQREIIRKQEKERANDEIHKKKLLNWSGKTKSKSNSKSNHFDTFINDFDLAEEAKDFNRLFAERSKLLRKIKRKRANDEIFMKKLLMWIGKTRSKSNRSVRPETTSRKSNLRSSDKDQESKLALDKAC